jgi:hypothetical protein
VLPGAFGAQHPPAPLSASSSLDVPAKVASGLCQLGSRAADVHAVIAELRQQGELAAAAPHGSAKRCSACIELQRAIVESSRPNPGTPRPPTAHVMRARRRDPKPPAAPRSVRGARPVPFEAPTPDSTYRPPCGLPRPRAASCNAGARLRASPYR